MLASGLGMLVSVFFAPMGFPLTDRWVRLSAFFAPMGFSLMDRRREQEDLAHKRQARARVSTHAARREKDLAHKTEARSPKKRVDASDDGIIVLLVF